MQARTTRRRARISTRRRAERREKRFDDTEQPRGEAQEDRRKRLRALATPASQREDDLAILGLGGDASDGYGSDSDEASGNEGAAAGGDVEEVMMTEEEARAMQARLGDGYVLEPAGGEEEESEGGEEEEEEGEEEEEEEEEEGEEEALEGEEEALEGEGETSAVGTSADECLRSFFATPNSLSEDCVSALQQLEENGHLRGKARAQFVAVLQRRAEQRAQRQRLLLGPAEAGSPDDAGKEPWRRPRPVGEIVKGDPFRAKPPRREVQLRLPEGEGEGETEAVFEVRATGLEGAAGEEEGGTGPWPLQRAPLRERLLRRWAELHGSSHLHGLPGLAAPALSQYRDVLVTGDTHATAPDLHALLALHALNHAQRARELVTKHDAQIAQAKAAARALSRQRKAASVLRRAATGAKEQKQNGGSRPLDDKKKKKKKKEEEKEKEKEEKEKEEKEEDEDSGSSSESEAEGAGGAGAPAGGGSALDRLLASVESGGGKKEGNGSAGKAAQSAAGAKAGASAVADGVKTVEEELEAVERRDQGFVRPRVLVLCPVRRIARQFVDSMLDLLPDTMQVGALPRFYEEFGDPPSSDEEGEEEEGAPKAKRRRQADSISGGPSKGKQRRRQRKRRLRRDAEWEHLLGGNADDCFKLGISLSRRAVKLYSGFYDSDIVVASPLGLHMITGAPDAKSRDTDFLSSIEVAIVLRGDVLLMQNWEVVTDVLGMLNQMPEKTREIDFSRVREFNLNGWAKYARQTVFTAGHVDAEVVSSFSAHCRNYRGRFLALERPTAGSIVHVTTPVPQLFRCIPCGAAEEQGEARLAHFLQHLLLPLTGCTLGQKKYQDLAKRATMAEEASSLATAGPSVAATGEYAAQGRTILFVASYFEFIRLRNALQAEAPNRFVFCSEYSSKSDVTRARHLFAKGEVPLLVVTERFHYFRRYRIRGARHAIFYGLPRLRSAYPHFLNLLEADQGPVSCTALFTEFEGHPLRRIVGTRRAKRMLSSDKRTFLFSSSAIQ